MVWAELLMSRVWKGGKTNQDNKGMNQNKCNDCTMSAMKGGKRRKKESFKLLVLLLLWSFTHFLLASCAGFDASSRRIINTYRRIPRPWIFDSTERFCFDGDSPMRDSGSSVGRLSKCIHSQIRSS